jgi:hypothetical protein
VGALAFCERDSEEEKWAEVLEEEHVNVYVYTAV